MMLDEPMVEVISMTAAKRRGLRFYYTGVPCRNGHRSNRWCTNRACRECLNEKKRANRPWAKASARNWKRNYDKLHYARIKERKRRQIKQWQAKNPARHKAISRNACRNRRARLKNATGNHSVLEIVALFMKQSGRCAGCLRSLRTGYHADHIVALVNGGSNGIGNIQLLCPRCNREKADKDPIAWAQEQGRLL